MTTAYGLNDAGQAVGVSQKAAQTIGGHAFRTAPNAAINPATDDLGVLGTGPFPGSASFGIAVNASGQVAGYSYVLGFSQMHGFRTGPNVAINPLTDDLGTLGGSVSKGLGINDSGQVVGDSLLSGDTVFHAFRTAPNAAINPATDDLGTLGTLGSVTVATAINNAGQAVGYCNLPSGASHAFRTGPNAAINQATDDLGTLGGLYSAAMGIDVAGDVVGYSYTGAGDFRAFLYTGSEMQDLNNFVAPAPSRDLQQANGINIGGQIAALGTNADGLPHAYRLEADAISRRQSSAHPDCESLQCSPGVPGIRRSRKRFRGPPGFIEGSLYNCLPFGVPQG